MGCELNGSVEVGQCPMWLVCGQVRRAEIAVDAGVVRRSGERPRVGADGIAHLPQREIRGPQVRETIRIARIELTRAPELPQGSGLVAGGQQRE